MCDRWRMETTRLLLACDRARSFGAPPVLVVVPAPPVSCSVERLQRFGWEAAKKMKRKEKNKGLAPVCDFFEVSRDCRFFNY